MEYIWIDKQSRHVIAGFLVCLFRQSSHKIISIIATEYTICFRLSLLVVSSGADKKRKRKRRIQFNSILFL